MTNTAKKIISLVVLVCFAMTQTVSANPGASIEIATRYETPSFLQIDIPAELATLDGLFEAPPRPDPRLVLHVQNAHANYGAQMKIKELLQYLHKTYGFKTIFVEGASEDLNPDYLRMFPDRERNMKLADFLMQQGELTGAELFILEQDGGGRRAEGAKNQDDRGEKADGVYAETPSSILHPLSEPSVRAHGIENAELYRENYDALKKVFGSGKTVTRYLGGYESRLDGLASKVFSPELRKLLGDWKKFEKGQREFMPYVHALTGNAKKILGVDLESLLAQVEWPQISRLLQLQVMEKELQTEKALAEKDKLITFLTAKRVTPELLAAIKDFQGQRVSVLRGKSDAVPAGLQPRDLMEKLVLEAGPKGFRFQDYPAFSIYAGYLILKNELDPKRLFEEIRTVFARMLDTLAKTPRQRELLAIYRDEELVRKLLNLELPRREWREAVAKQQELGMDVMVERLKTIGALVSKESNLPLSSFETKKVSEAFRQEVMGIQAAAFGFYDAARRREDVFYQKIEEVMTRNAESKAVLVTGGFHTDGITDLLREHQVSYGILTPRLLEKSDENLYRSVMLQNKQSTFELSYLEAVSRLQGYLAQGGQVGEVEVVASLEAVLRAIGHAGDLGNIADAIKIFNESSYAINGKIQIDPNPISNDEKGRPVYQVLHRSEARRDDLHGVAMPWYSHAVETGMRLSGNLFFDRGVGMMNDLLRRTDLTPEILERAFWGWHQVMDVAQGQKDIYRVQPEAIQQLFAKVLFDASQPVTRENVYEKVAELYYELHRMQPFVEGNHRAISLLVNFVFLKVGVPAFYLNQRNTPNYDEMRKLIRLPVQTRRNADWGKVSSDRLRAAFKNAGMELPVRPVRETSALNDDNLKKVIASFFMIEAATIRSESRTGEVLTESRVQSAADSLELQIEAVRRENVGKPTWMRAPNSSVTNLSERHWLLVRTPQFKSFFGDWEHDPQNASKVLDENGEPLLVWHGSQAAAAFDAFDPEAKRITDIGDLGWGSYFTGSRETAEVFTWRLNATQGPLVSAFLNIRNPASVETVQKNGGNGKSRTPEAAKSLVQTLTNLGHDGAFRTPLEVVFGKPVTEWVVYDNANIFMVSPDVLSEETPTIDRQNVPARVEMRTIEQTKLSLDGGTLQVPSIAPGAGIQMVVGKDAEFQKARLESRQKTVSKREKLLQTVAVAGFFAFWAGFPDLSLAREKTAYVPYVARQEKAPSEPSRVAPGVELLDFTKLWAAVMSQGVLRGVTEEDLRQSIDYSNRPDIRAQVQAAYAMLIRDGLLPEGTKFPVVLLKGIDESLFSKLGISADSFAVAPRGSGVVFVPRVAWDRLDPDVSKAAWLLVKAGHEARHHMDLLNDPNISTLRTEANAYAVTARSMELAGYPEEQLILQRQVASAFKVLADSEEAVSRIFGKGTLFRNINYGNIAVDGSGFVRVELLDEVNGKKIMIGVDLNAPLGKQIFELVAKPAEQSSNAETQTHAVYASRESLGGVLTPLTDIPSSMVLAVLGLMAAVPRRGTRAGQTSAAPSKSQETKKKLAAVRSESRAQAAAEGEELTLDQVRKEFAATFRHEFADDLTVLAGLPQLLIQPELFPEARRTSIDLGRKSLKALRAQVERLRQEQGENFVRAPNHGATDGSFLLVDSHTQSYGNNYHQLSQQWHQYARMEVLALVNHKQLAANLEMVIDKAEEWLNKVAAKLAQGEKLADADLKDGDDFGETFLYVLDQLGRGEFESWVGEPQSEGGSLQVNEVGTPALPMVSENHGYWVDAITNLARQYGRTLRRRTLSEERLTVVEIPGRDRYLPGAFHLLNAEGKVIGVSLVEDIIFRAVDPKTGEPIDDEVIKRADGESMRDELNATWALEEAWALKEADKYGYLRAWEAGVMANGQGFWARLKGPKKGQDLSQANPRLSVIDLFKGLAGAGERFVQLHQAGLIHGDIKPGNILLGEDPKGALDVSNSYVIDLTGVQQLGANPDAETVLGTTWMNPLIKMEGRPVLLQGWLRTQEADNFQFAMTIVSLLHQKARLPGANALSPDEAARLETKYLGRIFTRFPGQSARRMFIQNKDMENFAYDIYFQHPEIFGVRPMSEIPTMAQLTQMLKEDLAAMEASAAGRSESRAETRTEGTTAEDFDEFVQGYWRENDLGSEEDRLAAAKFYYSSDSGRAIQKGGITASMFSVFIRAMGFRGKDSAAKTFAAMSALRKLRPLYPEVKLSTAIDMLSKGEFDFNKLGNSGEVALASFLPAVRTIFLRNGIKAQVLKVGVDAAAKAAETKTAAELEAEFVEAMQARMPAAETAIDLRSVLKELSSEEQKSLEFKVAEVRNRLGLAEVSDEVVRVALLVGGILDLSKADLPEAKRRMMLLAATIGGQATVALRDAFKKAYEGQNIQLPVSDAVGLVVDILDAMPSSKKVEAVKGMLALNPNAHFAWIVPAGVDVSETVQKITEWGNRNDVKVEGRLLVSGVGASLANSINSVKKRIKRIYAFVVIGRSEDLADLNVEQAELIERGNEIPQDVADVAGIVVSVERSQELVYGGEKFGEKTAQAINAKKGKRFSFNLNGLLNIAKSLAAQLQGLLSLEKSA